MVSADMDGETVMMSIEQGSYFGLRGIAPDLWNWMEKPLSVSELCDRVMEDYEVDRPTCEKDVITLLEDLQSRELIIAG